MKEIGYLIIVNPYGGTKDWHYASTPEELVSLYDEFTSQYGEAGVVVFPVADVWSMYETRTKIQAIKQEESYDYETEQV